MLQVFGFSFNLTSFVVALINVLELVFAASNFYLYCFCNSKIRAKVLLKRNVKGNDITIDCEGSSLDEVLAMVGSGKIRRIGTKERRGGDKGEGNSEGFSHLPKSVFILAIVTKKIQRYAVVA